MWDVTNKGFFSISDPLNSLPINDIRNTELIYTWENLSNVLPHYLKEECLREELIHDLRTASHSYYHGFVDNLGGPCCYERTFLLMAYFATAYINSPEGKQKKKLPKEITMPLVRVAHLVGRQPVLDYTSFILYNWKRKNNSDELTRDNIEVIHTFTDSPYEQLLLSAFIEMECIGIELINHIANPFSVAEDLCKINKILKRVWSEVPYEFLDHWSILVDNYKNLIYEQWRPDIMNFPCDILLQSPLLFTIYKYLDIEFKNSYIKERNRDIVNWHMPAAHRIFIGNVNGIRNRCNEGSFKEAYNNCLEQLIKLREQLVFRKWDRDMGVVTTGELGGYYLM